MEGIGLRGIASHVDGGGCVSRFTASPRPSSWAAVLNQELPAARVRMSVGVKHPTDGDEDDREHGANRRDKARAGLFGFQFCAMFSVVRIVVVCGWNRG